MGDCRHALTCHHELAQFIAAGQVTEAQLRPANDAQLIDGQQPLQENVALLDGYVGSGTAMMAVAKAEHHFRHAVATQLAPGADLERPFAGNVGIDIGAGDVDVDESTGRNRNGVTRMVEHQVLGCATEEMACYRFQAQDLVEDGIAFSFVGGPITLAQLFIFYYLCCSLI